MPTTLRFFLDNPYASYFPGQVVTGQLVVDLTAERKTKGLKIVCSGKASVSWTQSRKIHARRPPVGPSVKHFAATENYFYYKIYVVGRKGGPDVTLTEGQNVYPFIFQLPPRLPSSFQGPYGYVQYSLQATLKKSWSSDKTMTRPFTVNGILDLNTYIGANQPGQLLKSKCPSYYSCKSGPITLTAKLDKIGFVPGEPLPFVGEVNNLSNHEVRGLYLRVVSHVTFHAQGDGNKKHYYQRIDLFRFDRTVRPGESEIFRSSDLRIPIPILPPTHLAGGCRIISLEHQLEIELDLSGQRFFKGGIPIIIGTIPFWNYFPQLVPAASDSIPSAPPGQSIPGYPELPPLTYQEACKLPGNVAEDDELPTYGEALNAETEENRKGAFQFDSNFVPKYASYRVG